jgi:hypothetical protein
MSPHELLIETAPFIAPARALEGLTAEDADRRLSPAHSIAQIVAHLAFWQDWFRERCGGGTEPMAASAALGWVAPPPGAWPEVRTGRTLAATHGPLAAAVGQLDLVEPNPDLSSRASDLGRSILARRRRGGKPHIAVRLSLGRPA